jgi:hypothetical protein
VATLAAWSGGLKQNRCPVWPKISHLQVYYYLFGSSHAATILIVSPLKRRVQIIQLHVLLWLRRPR